MKLNERSLAFYATCDSPADNSGFLFKKGERNTAYHRRWFVLKGNMLFYFEERESREPVGAIILEGCTVELCEAAEEFAFAIKFDCAKSRTYILAAESQASMESWVKSLSRASFDYLRLVVKELEKQLKEMQRELAGGRSAQRRSPVYQAGNRKIKPALGSDAPSPAPELPTSTALSGNAGGAGVLVTDSLVCLGPAYFSKLHDWYGREITELRREWLERQSHEVGRGGLFGKMKPALKPAWLRVICLRDIHMSLLCQRDGESVCPGNCLPGSSSGFLLADLMWEGSQLVLTSVSGFRYLLLCPGPCLTLPFLTMDLSSSDQRGFAQPLTSIDHCQSFAV
uniref:Sesquipedalian n=1 Tax=Pelusios castaneus TaxID=367368 RepID=A0A8C8RKT3_9SAUR